MQRNIQHRDIHALLTAMTIEEKVASMLAARIVANDDGTLWEGREGESSFGFLPSTEVLLERGISHIGLMNTPPVASLARWSSRVQELAAQTRLGLPVTVMSDPRHGRARNVDVAQSGGGFTTMTEPIGLAAIEDLSLVTEAAAMMARELRAAGIHLALHPMADLATEPRWARIAGTFGEDREHATQVMLAYLRGLHAGAAEERVLATAKHFPGGGPQDRGEDSHFEVGANTVYPGGRFEAHLAPFAAAVDAGIARIMPGYAAPVGTDFDEVGFAFQHALITGVLRERLGFDGVVLSDFNVVTGMRLPALGLELPVRAWGLLHLDEVERAARLVNAGVDQLGGEDDPSHLLAALERGLVTEARIDESVLRILREKQELGLLERPLAGVREPERIREVIGCAAHREVAERVQAASIVALAGSPVTLTPETQIYAEGIARDVLARFGTPVDDPAEAEVAILRLDAPFERREGLLESAFHSGSLEFEDAEIERIATIARQVPRLLIDVFLERPAVLEPLLLPGVTLIGTFGVDDDVLLRAVSGETPVHGRLPFDIASSMRAVEASREDVAFDTEAPSFRFGHGLRWGSSS